MFAVIFICENLFLRIAGKTAKLEPANILCHTVVCLKNIILFLENSDLLCLWIYVTQTWCQKTTFNLLQQEYKLFFIKNYPKKEDREGRYQTVQMTKGTCFLPLLKNQDVLSGLLAMSPQLGLLYPWPTDQLTVINFLLQFNNMYLYCSALDIMTV